MVNQNALILSGGGARAAYQVGVLSAVGKMVVKGSPLPFPILCGTSAGALNATMLATHADNFTKAVAKLAFVWRHLNTDKVYTMGRWPIATSITRTLMSLFHTQNHNTPVALMSNHPLKELLDNFLDFSKLDQSLKNQHLTALAITAMSYSTGESTTFMQGVEQLQPWQGNRRRGVMDTISTNHLLASSAIPGIFPAQKVHDHYYGDGAIRQKSAIYPAIQMGAKKLFIIGVSGNINSKQSVDEIAQYSSPSIAQILGQLLNSAFIDNLEDDIQQLEIMNQLIQNVPEDKRGQYMLPTDTLIISPSQEVNNIAEHYIHTLPKNIRVLIKATGGSISQTASSAASYLLFTPEYCKAMMELGYKDALSEKDKILAFLSE